MPASAEGVRRPLSAEAKRRPLSEGVLGSALRHIDSDFDEAYDPVMTDGIDIGDPIRRQRSQSAKQRPKKKSATSDILVMPY